MTREEIINEIKCLLFELNSGEDAVSYLTQNDVKWLNENIKALEQEPFINKPCVSEKVCEHDKQMVLNKIRAEIDNDWQLKKYPSSPFSCGLRRAIEIIDKYKAEFDPQKRSDKE